MDSAEDVLIPIAVMLTAVLIAGIIAWAVVQFARARASGRAGGPRIEDEVARLREQVDRLGHQLADTQSRMDTTERLLPQSRQDVQESS